MLDPSRTNSMGRRKEESTGPRKDGTLSRKGDTLSRKTDTLSRNKGDTLSRQNKGDTLSRQGKGDTLSRQGKGDNSTLGRKGILKTANNAAAASLPPAASANPGLLFAFSSATVCSRPRLGNMVRGGRPGLGELNGPNSRYFLVIN